MDQVRVHNKLTAWAVRADPGKRGLAQRFVCVKDGGMVVWGIPLRDTMPADESGDAAAVVAAGAVWVSGGIVPIRRGDIIEGTCIRVTRREMARIWETAEAFLFGAAGYAPTVWQVAPGRRWLSVREDREASWVMAVTDDAALSGPLVAAGEDRWVAVRGGVRPARRAKLRATETSANVTLGCLRRVSAEFFLT